MNATLIVYDPSEKWLLRGDRTGLVELARVNPHDGSPGERVCTSFFHKTEISVLAFGMGGERFVSADTSGRVEICSSADGARLHTLDVGGEDVSGGVSPDGRTLFLFAHEGAKNSNVFAVDLQDGKLI